MSQTKKTRLFAKMFYFKKFIGRGRAMLRLAVLLFVSGCGGTGAPNIENKLSTNLEIAPAESSTGETVSEASLKTDPMATTDGLDGVSDSASSIDSVSLESEKDMSSEIDEKLTDRDASTGLDPDIEETGCVGNFVWLDTDLDGRQGINEQGISDIRINLVDLNGVAVAAAVTDRGYFETCANPGKYQLVVEVPAVYKVTIKGSGSDPRTDSNAEIEGVLQVEIESGNKNVDYDIGLTSTYDETSNFEPEDNSQSDLKWGFWTESRNAFPEDGRRPEPDEGVETAFDNYSFAHVKALSLSAVNGDVDDRTYVVNILEEAERYGVSLDLQLGSSSDYGWNFTTSRGNFNIDRWKDGISRFGEHETVSFSNSNTTIKGDAIAFRAISRALSNGTIRYIFLIDEPNHKRWSPSWDGSHGSNAPGNPNHVTNVMLDEMALHVKTVFGNSTQTIVRTSPTNLVVGSRDGLHVFEHLTHAYLTLSSTKWTAGSNKGPGKGLEWFLTEKNNHTDNLTNMSAFSATNLKPSLMVQAGFQSNGNPWTGLKDFSDEWWDNDISYPYNGATSYVKTAPGEMDYWIKSMISPRDPVSGKLSDTGVRMIDEFVIFRADRLPTDSGKLPFSTYPHYRAFLDQLRLDIERNNLLPVIGIPVGWEGG